MAVDLSLFPVLWIFDTVTGMESETSEVVRRIARIRNQA
jgi:hypothetical protein